MKKNGRKLIKKAFALMLAVVMAVPMVDYGTVMTASAEEPGVVGTENITLRTRTDGKAAADGYDEGAYVEWLPVAGADGYQVYVSQDQNSWPEKPIDDELIRSYGTYFRADALGLTKGTWYVKIEAVTLNNGQIDDTVDTKTQEVPVTAHDRSGYAWQGNGTASGAYNENGSLKSDARVIYVSNATKNTVSLVTEENGTCVGLQNILNAYKTGKETKPLNVRIIGNVTDFVNMNAGDIVVENGNKNNASITIEGVGEDAVANGWGIRISNSSNVEIRNLGFMNCNSNEGDNVSLENNDDHIWVHNCDFFYGEAGSDDDQKKGDGMLDCKNSNWVTFSYNHFWDSGKSCLLGLIEGSETKRYITYHHNWFDHSDSRHPRIRYYNAHIYNNYYDGNAKYGIGAAEGGVSVFAESNYFRNCALPMLISQQGSDLKVSNGKFQDPNDSSKFEDGSIIKAYKNYIEGAESFIPYVAPTTQADSAQDEERGFTAYVALDENVNNDNADISDVDSVNENDSKANRDSKPAEGDNADTANVDDVDSKADSDGIADENNTTTDSTGTADADSTTGSDNAVNSDNKNDTDSAAGSDNVNDDNATDSDDSNAEDNNVVDTDESEVLGVYEDDTESLDLEAEVSYAQSADFTTDASVDFDAYVVENRGDKVPQSVITKKGGHTYDNFDTASDFYEYEADAAEKVPEIVMAKAGRLNGGDFKWTFDNEKDDGSDKLNTALKDKCTGYTSSLVSVGGIKGTSTICYFTVTVDPGNGDAAYTVKVEENHKMDSIAAPEKAPEGKVKFDGWSKEGSPFLWNFDNNIVTNDMTLVGKWLAEGEQGGSYGVTPIGNAMVIHDFTTQGTSSEYFETITGQLYDNSGTSAKYTHNDETYQYKGRGLAMNNAVEIAFTTTTSAKLVLLLHVGTIKSHYVDGKRYTSEGGIIEVNIGEGEHTIKGYNSSSYLYAIMVFPGESVEEKLSYKMELFASDITNGTYSENIEIEESGFTITADASHDVEVGSSSKTINGVKYDARLRTRGTGAPDYRSIKFEASDPSTLYIACMSASSGNSHKVGIATLNAQGTFEEYSGNIIVDGKSMDYNDSETYVDSSDGHYISLRLPKADTYYVYGKTGNISFYYISVTYDNIVTFESNGGTAVDSQTIEKEKACTKPTDPTKDGYTFAGWYTDSECTAGNEYNFTTPITADITLYAKWTKGSSENPTSHTVTFNTNGGSAVPAQTIENGNLCTRPDDPTKDNCTFEGWYKDEELKEEYDFSDPVTAGITLYAKWKDNGTENPDPGKQEGFKIKFKNDQKQYTYTGSAIIPEITVTYNGEKLVKDTDYTVKYSNNIKAASKELNTDTKKLPKVTVTGKGRFSGNNYENFEILQKSIDADDVTVSGVVKADNTDNASDAENKAESKTITVVQGAKVDPLIYYNNVKLTTKDYTVTGASGKKYTAADNNKTLTITAKPNSNYKGTLTLTLNVIEKGEKFKVSFKKEAVNNLVYNGQKQEIAPVLEPGSMAKGTDYAIQYSNAVNAGTVKCTVIGMGKYTGCCVTKTYKIKAAKKDNNAFNVEVLPDNGIYPYESAGVTLGDDLKVYDKEIKIGENQKLLELGKDYKVTYSNNKKVSTESKKASYKITFLGNYKGSKPISNKFTINKTLLCNNSDNEAKNTKKLDIVFPNKVSNGKDGIYKSVPYVSIDGITLKKSDYNVAYYTDSTLKTLMDAQHKVSAGATVYVKITGKGNYDSTDSEYIKAEYIVQSKPANTIGDLSKANVTLNAKKVEYTGNAQVDNVKEITIKVNGTKQTIAAKDFTANGIKVQYVNNKAKGKATIVISGDGTKFVGSKTTTFSITARKFKLASAAN